MLSSVSCVTPTQRSCASGVNSRRAPPLGRVGYSRSANAEPRGLGGMTVYAAASGSKDRNPGPRSGFWGPGPAGPGRPGRGDPVHARAPGGSSRNLRFREGYSSPGSSRYRANIYIKPYSKAHIYGYRGYTWGYISYGYGGCPKNRVSRGVPNWRIIKYPQKSEIFGGAAPPGSSQPEGYSPQDPRIWGDIPVISRISCGYTELSSG